MRMGLRDRKFWLKEALLKLLYRRLENYGMAIFPQREDADKEVKRLNLQIYEIEHQEEIDLVEMDVRKKMKQLEEMRKSRRKKE